MEALLILASLPATFIMAISLIAFARLSMARIERDMKRDGLPRPCSWDRSGGRLALYALVIVFHFKRWDDPKQPLTPFIDVAAVRQYATRFDRRLGLFHLIAMNTWLVLMLFVVWAEDLI